MILITTHIGADFDAVASLLAASKLYADAKIYLPGSPEKKVRQYINEKEFPMDFSNFNDIKDMEFDRVIVVDTSYLDRIGRAAELITDKTDIFIYDHHPRPKEDSGGVNADFDLHKLWGATVTILVEEIRKKDIKLTPEEASVLLTGIYEDTGCLTYPITTRHDIDAASWLLEEGANLNTVSRYAVHNLSEEQIHLLDRLLNNKSFLNIGKKKIAVTWDVLEDYIEELAVVVRKFTDTISPDALFAILKIKENILCIARSRDEDIDVSNIISDLGGSGGHRSAATVSFNEDSVTIEELKIKIRESLYNNIGKTEDPPRAGSKVIPRDDTARRAYHTLNHLNLKYAPVGGEEGFIDGLVLRAELKKAIKHGLGEHKVLEFLTEKVSYDPTSKNPHVEDEFPEHTIKPVYRDVKNKFNNNLSESGRDIIRTAAEVAEEMGVEAYCVGGMVRDMILSIRHSDIDIVVKEEADEFSRRLAKALGGSYYTHGKFRTAVVNIPGREIDIATLRKEYYEARAALPEVHKGTLKQDLARRDFSINAMAVQIAPSKEYGQLIDYFGGLEDIENKSIRILYPLSFIEDPTRIFRAARFEKRFNFEMTSATLSKLKKTVNMDIQEELTPDRIKEEIFKILSEAKASDIISRLESLGAFKCIDSQLEVSGQSLDIIKNFNSRAEIFKDAIKDKINYNKNEILLLAFISGLPRDRGQRMLNIFNFSNRIKKAFKDFKSRGGRLDQVLEKDLSPGRIFKALNKLSPLALYYILIRTSGERVRKNIMEYLEHIKDIKPVLSGADLIEMGYEPSRRFSRMLYTLKIAKINGLLSSPEDEKKFIATYFKE